jgi:hypothetical protein
MNMKRTLQRLGIDISNNQSILQIQNFIGTDVTIYSCVQTTRIAMAD